MDHWDFTDEQWNLESGADGSYQTAREFPTTEFSGGSAPTGAATPGLRAWQRFLFLATLLTCTLVAGLLSLVTFQNSSAMAALQSSNQGSQKSGQASFSDLDDQQPQSSGDTLEKPSLLKECQVSAQFPAKIRRWCDLITTYADKRGLPADLVAAVILQESGGNPQAFSQSGAVGLMQVMPRDGLAAAFLCVNGPCFANRPSRQALSDPEFNLSYGTKMLSGLVRKHGSLREALKSYGPMNVGYMYADKVLGIYQRYGK